MCKLLFLHLIVKFVQRQNDAVNSKQESFYSLAVFVHRYRFASGLLICLRLESPMAITQYTTQILFSIRRFYLNGDGLGKFVSVCGFRFPFKQKGTLFLYDQNFRAHINDAFQSGPLALIVLSPGEHQGHCVGQLTLRAALHFAPSGELGDAFIKEDLHHGRGQTFSTGDA